MTNGQNQAALLVLHAGLLQLDKHYCILLGVKATIFI